MIPALPVLRSRALFLAFVALLFAIAAPVGAQPVPERPSASESEALWQIPFEQILPYDDVCGLQKVDLDVGTSVRPRPGFEKRAKSTAIVVDYGNGFTAEAQTAFQRAVDIWATHVESDVEIRIDASFESLPSGVLGAAGPRFAYGVDTNGDGTEDAIFGDALIDAIEGVDIACVEFNRCGDVDIVARFNRSRDDWHFGPDDAPAGRVDFTSVVLHEIGHGLNFIDQMDVSRSEGRYGFDFDNSGSLDASEKIPSIFGAFLAEDTGSGLQLLVNTDVYPNPSAALADALTSGQLFFVGTNAEQSARRGNGPVPPKMYAPSTFQNGSSIAHVDEFTYPPGDPDALMTPQISTNETARMPGPVVCGIFGDMGWPLGDGCLRYFQDAFAFSAAATTSEGTVSLSWQTRPDASIGTYFIDEKRFDGSFQQVASLPGTATPEVDLTGRGLGEYTYRLRWQRLDGSTVAATSQPTVTLNVTNVEAAPEGAPDDFERADLRVTWSVPPSTSNFEYVVERRQGDADDGGAFEPVGTTSETTFLARRQVPGTYGYRIVARQATNPDNTLTSPTATVRVEFSGAASIIGPYPNPVQNVLSIDYTSRRNDPVVVELFNTLGQRVYRERRDVSAGTPTQVRIDVSGLASGIYVLRLNAGDVQRTRRVAVNH